MENLRENPTNEDNFLRELLFRVSRGATELMPRMLEVFSVELVVVPASVVENEKGEIVDLSIATFSFQKKKMIPVFTDQKLFLNWSKGKYECLPITGEELFSKLDGAVWLFIDPGQPDFVEVPPRAIKDYLEEIEQEQKVENVEDIVTSSVPNEEEVHVTSTENDSTTIPSAIEELQELFKNYPEIVEGYLTVQTVAGHQVKLGLITRGMKVARRFSLIDEVAAVSRNVFGQTGSIELYDDLNIPSSRSWTHFKDLTPFYNSGSTFPPNL